MKISVLITAAGYSERMGSHKALLKYNDNQSFLEKIIDNYKKLVCEQIVVTANADLFKQISYLNSNQVKIIENHHPELERIFSVKLGLQALNNADFCFLQSVDNPFVKLETLLKLAETGSNEKFIAPCFQNKSGHPILINRKIINELIKNTDYQIKLNQFLKIFPKLKIETDDESVLLNINTQTDYQNIIRRLTDN